MHKRLDEFWGYEILSLRDTEVTILLVTHGGLIGTLRKYLFGRGYTIHPALKFPSRNLRIPELRNCSITEISIPKKGPGEFIRMGEWEHLCSAYGLQDTEAELVDSTGN